jgi:hypothetical protein
MAMAGRIGLSAAHEKAKLTASHKRATRHYAKDNLGHRQATLCLALRCRKFSKIAAFALQFNVGDYHYNSQIGLAKPARIVTFDQRPLDGHAASKSAYF